MNSKKMENFKITEWENVIIEGLKQKKPLHIILKELELSNNIIEVKRNIYPQQAVKKTYILSMVRKLNFSKTIKEINNNPEIIESLGFLKNEKDEWQLPTVNTLRFYKKNYEKNQEIKEVITRLRTEEITMVNKTKTAKSIKERELTRQAKIMMEKYVGDERHHNKKHKSNDILDILNETAYKRDYINKNTSFYKEHEPEENNPSRRETFYFMNKISDKKDLVKMYNNVYKEGYNFFKKNYRILNRGHTIAVDIHEVPFFGKRTSYALGCKNARGTNKALKYLVCSLAQYPRMVLCVMPIKQLDLIDDILDNMLFHVQSFVKVDKILLDRGFNGSNFINVLKRRRLIYIMPQRRGNRIEEHMRKCEGSKSRVFKDYKYGNATTNLVIVEAPNGEKVIFSTNWDINENLTQYLFKYYNSKGFSARWSIENVFKTITHDFKIKTTSTNYQIRLFEFLYANMLYNSWITVNLFINIILYGKTKQKSIITAKTFIRILHQKEKNKEKIG